MGTLTIGEVAERTGFTTSALRYYEGIGLVAPAARTGAGYRVYGEDTLGRLAFIARAKQLGCTLEEITDLVAIWDGDRCGPVQRRFHALVTTKIAETQDRLRELTEFADQLRMAAAQLSGEPADGPCDEGCACVAVPPSGSGAPVALGAEPASTRTSVVACTLTGDEVQDRERDWQELLAHVTARSAAPDGALRLSLDDTTPLAELARLVAAEQRCCAFFAFTITVDAHGTTLEVRAPADAAPVVAALFGAVA